MKNNTNTQFHCPTTKNVEKCAERSVYYAPLILAVAAFSAAAAISFSPYYTPAETTQSSEELIAKAVGAALVGAAALICWATKKKPSCESGSQTPLLLGTTQMKGSPAVCPCPC